MTNTPPNTVIELYCFDKAANRAGIRSIICLCWSSKACWNQTVSWIWDWSTRTGTKDRKYPLTLWKAFLSSKAHAAVALPKAGTHFLSWQTLIPSFRCTTSSWLRPWSSPPSQAVTPLLLCCTTSGKHVGTAQVTRKPWAYPPLTPCLLYTPCFLYWKDKNLFYTKYWLFFWFTS